MKIIIKEREYDYASDYPDGWKHFANDSFKMPVEIGIYKCFIKRFERKDPNTISGWQLLHNLKGRNVKNLPRIYDTAGVKEDGKSVQYVFYEFLQGDTLDKLISKKVEVNLIKLTDDLFNALSSLQNDNYWFADFCEKNIFCEKSGNFLFVDLDSAQTISSEPDKDMYGNKEYWSLVFNFYIKVLRKQNFKPSDINGITLNYLQVIFLILRLKIWYSNADMEYDELFSDLPAYLRKADPYFSTIFQKVIQHKETPPQTDDVRDIQNLIKEKILNNVLDLDKTEDIEEPHATSKVTENDDINSVPRINHFAVSNYFEKNGDDYTVESGNAYTLTWSTENAPNAELHKNGALFKKLDPGENSMELKEFAFDGKEKKTEYTLHVSNEFIVAESSPVTVIVREIVHPDVDINQFTVTDYVSRYEGSYIVESGKQFSLTWDVKNAQNIELYKNGRLYKKINANENVVEITEPVYDGRENKINYTLKASKGSGEAKSKSLTVIVREIVYPGVDINQFTATNYISRDEDNYTVESGRSFSLIWDVKSAQNIELYKNGQLYKKFNVSENAAEITEKFYDGSGNKINYTLKASKGSGEVKSKSLIIIVKQPAPLKPVVWWLKSSKYTIRGEGSFTLMWDVQNALAVKLFKNDVLLYTYEKGEKAAEFKENYAGREKKIKYVLEASNTAGNTISDAVFINVKARINWWKIVTIGLALLVIAFVFFYVVPPNEPKPEPSFRFDKTEIFQNDTITIFGKNIPKQEGSLEVKFNDTLGTIIQQTEDSIRVVVPPLSSGSPNVNIVAYANKVPYMIAEKATYKQPLIVTPITIIVYSLTKTQIAQDETIPVYGKNLPLDEGSIQVKFNGIEGTTSQPTKDSFNVMVPRLTGNYTDVRIIAYIKGIKGDSQIIAEHITYQPNDRRPYVGEIRQDQIIEDQIINIPGARLPENIQVKFNEVEGLITLQTRNRISVMVPDLQPGSYNGTNVDIKVYVNGRVLKNKKVNYRKRTDFLPSVDPFDFNEVKEGDIITITGKNFPTYQDAIWVQFNFVKGKIIAQTQNSIRVEVPGLTASIKEVEIGVYAYKKLVRSDGHVRYHIR